MNQKESQIVSIQEKHKSTVLPIVEESKIQDTIKTLIYPSSDNNISHDPSMINPINEKKTLSRPILRRMANRCEISHTQEKNKIHKCFMYYDDNTKNVQYCFFCGKKIEQTN